MPSSPEETNKKKHIIKIDDFFQNASILLGASDSEGIRSTKQHIRHLNKPATMIEKEKIKGMGKTAKKVGGIPEIHLPRRKVKK